MLNIKILYSQWKEENISENLGLENFRNKLWYTDYVKNA